MKQFLHRVPWVSPAVACCACRSEARCEELAGADTTEPRRRWFGSSSFSVRGSARCVSKASPRAVAPPIQHDCGDDAFFIKPSARRTDFGIADGVSSWKRMGVDPALFAWRLMESCERSAHSAKASPKEILAAGYELLMSNRPPHGSSTACLCSLDSSTGDLSIANLGDSGAMLVRGNTCVLKTKEQSHFFNCPYQLTGKSLDGEGRNSGDSPSSADAYVVEVCDGDLLVVATDGFFDNVWHDNILKVLAEMHGEEPARIADRLVRLANLAAHAHDPTPFSESALRQGMNHPGGKVDDITVIVARVVKS